MSAVSDGRCHGDRSIRPAGDQQILEVVKGFIIQTAQSCTAARDGSSLKTPTEAELIGSAQSFRGLGYNNNEHGSHDCRLGV